MRGWVRVAFACAVVVHPAARTETGAASPTDASPLPLSGADAPGEAQARHLVQMAQDAGRPELTMPLAPFCEQVAAAVRVHPEVAGAQAALLASAAGTREREAAWQPQLSAELDAGRRISDESVVLGNPKRRYPVGSVGLLLRQQLLDFGGTDAGIAAAQAREGESAARRDSRAAELALRMVQAWLELYRSRKVRADV